MLTDTTIKALKPLEKPYKRFDGAGLYLLINPTGSKLWRCKYRHGGKEQLLTLGSYPEVSLKEAREKRDEARGQLRRGVDPNHARRAMKLSSHAGNSFGAVTREWLQNMAAKWTFETAERTTRRLEADVLPWLAERPVAEIRPTELLAVLKRIEARGAIDTAHRALQECQKIFRFAVITGRAEYNPAVELRGALTPNREEHHATITDPRAVGALLRAIDGYRGNFVTRCALKLAPLVFVRPGELRKARWSEIDFDRAEWRIPAERMKMRKLHIVPLSTQAVAILRDVQALTGSGEFVFPSGRSRKRPMSENAVLSALRRMHYGTGEMTGHGFRSMASTLLNEAGWNRDAIERQLAHAERDGVRAAYNYAEHLAERKQMMQWYADYLDALREERNVVTIGKRAA